MKLQNLPVAARIALVFALTLLLPIFLYIIFVGPLYVLSKSVVGVIVGLLVLSFILPEKVGAGLRTSLAKSIGAIIGGYLKLISEIIAPTKPKKKKEKDQDDDEDE